MSAIDQLIKKLIIEKVQDCEDASLLYLIYKLLLREGH